MNSMPTWGWVLASIWVLTALLGAIHDLCAALEANDKGDIAARRKAMRSAFASFIWPIIVFVGLAAWTFDAAFPLVRDRRERKREAKKAQAERVDDWLRWTYQ